MPEIACSALDEILPFALVIGAGGEIVHMGRSIKKAVNLGRDQHPNFFDIFSIAAPRTLAGKKDLRAACGKSVTLDTWSEQLGKTLSFRAAIALADGDKEQFIVLTSLGLELPEVIEPLGLFDRDFAYPDASVDLLYVLDSRDELMRNALVLNERIEKAKNLAEKQARTDALTGLSNRRALIEFAEAFITTRKDAARLFHIDLDLFKQVNDRLGHAAGDAILKRIADDLRSFAGPKDMVARTGGDEFVWISTNPSAIDDIDRLATQLIEKINAPLRFGSQFAEVSASIGMTVITSGGEKGFDDFLLEADLALYEVKKSGRGMFKAFTSDMMDRENITRQLMRDIEPAMENGEFVPHFQLQIDCSTKNVFGVEVLGRWLHPKHGIIPPEEFLYVAERARLLEKIDLAIFGKALGIFANWKAQGIAPPHLSLNLTEKMLRRFDFVDQMKSEVEKRNLAPCDIVFELLETVLIDGEGDDMRNTTEALVQAGFTLAIDDFGTGRASLTSLISVPVNIVKIDRAFVSEIHKSSKKQLLADSIISLAKKLKLNVLAEGVETKEERDLLQNFGCELFQGYYFGRPVGADAFTEILRDEAWRGEENNDRHRLDQTKTAS